MPIRVLLVEDSPVALAILKKILDSAPEIEVVGTARSGKEALAMISKTNPQVICTDLYMPEMNGLEFTEEVMATCPKPILVVSAAVQEEDANNVFRLLAAGAVDIFPKPRAGLPADYERAKQELISKIKVLAGVAVFTQHRRLPETKNIAISEKPISPPLAEVKNVEPPKAQEFRALIFPKIVVIGASTGGPQALQSILSQLPEKFPVPVVCIQHISEGFLQGLVDWLGAECKLPVKIAPAGELMKSGTIYFAPEGQHLEFSNGGYLIHSKASAVGGHRPSVTITLQSAARCYGRSTVGVLLTGMGRDGADGMLAIKKAGGTTIAQDEASCVVFGMPKEAIALGAAEYILPVKDIATMLLRLTAASHPGNSAGNR